MQMEFYKCRCLLQGKVNRLELYMSTYLPTNVPLLTSCLHADRFKFFNLHLFHMLLSLVILHQVYCNRKISLITFYTCSFINPS
ncbi:hypothetical protein K445DRAFT_113532 [Daldinia sp. EC12]|nr:hypothetical protein K445DRAFT_113532 [Daldinia sp. EC12]